MADKTVEQADAAILTAAAEAAVAENPLDIYNRIITWYVHRPSIHGPALLLFVSFALAGVLSARFEWLHMSTPCLLNGYVLYTPVYWVLGFINWLLFAFTLRYSNLSGSSFAVARQAFQRFFSPFIQWALVLITLTALVYEMSGLTHDFTLSSELRDQTIGRPVAYWLFGVLAGALAGALVDVQVPQLIRLMLVVWVATLAHVFWWITPPNPTHFDAKSVIQSGLVKIEPKIPPGHLPEFVSKAKNRIRIFVPWFTEPLSLKSVLQDKIALKNMSIEIFVMDPASKFLDQRGKVVQPGKPNYGRDEAIRSLTTLKEAFESVDQSRVHVFAVQSLPSVMMVEVDDSAYLGYYMHSGVATQNPVMTMVTKRGKELSLFGEMIDKEFRNLKRYSVDLDISSIHDIGGGILEYKPRKRE